MDSTTSVDNFCQGVSVGKAQNVLKGLLGASVGLCRKETDKHSFLLITIPCCGGIEIPFISIGASTMQQAIIKAVKQGEYIKRKADAKTVYIKGAYDRASKSFECTDTEDMNKQIYIKADKPVFIGFTY
jgi:hypothetical protein